MTVHTGPVPAPTKATPTTAKAAVLIPVLNEERFLPQLFKALQHQDYDGPMEFLFIDGGSTDATQAMVTAQAEVDSRFILLHNPGKITPKALNIGLHATNATYIVRFDGHTTYPAHYIRGAIERLAQGDVISASGPALPVGHDWGSTVVAAALTSKMGVGGAQFRTAIDREVVIDSGFCGVWLRETLTAAGGWDETTYPNEDAELAARLRAGGGRIVCVPELAAHYSPRNSLAGLARQYYKYGTYRVKTSCKHPESVRSHHLIPPAFVAMVAAATIAPKPLRTIARGGCAAYLTALAGLALTKTRQLGVSAAALPAVYVTMHAAWGTGYLRGCAKFGVPWRGLQRLASRSTHLKEIRDDET